MIPQRPLGKTGLRVSRLGFGGAPIGFSDVRPEDAVGLVRRAVELGITFFDTAPDYRRSEEILGKALEGRRAEVILATKVGRLQTPRGEGWAQSEDWSAVGIRRTIEESLRRLGTDYLDLVQLHSPPLQVVEAGAALGALARAREAGLIREIGLSADSEVAARALEQEVFATLQVSYSVLQQGPAQLVARAAALGVGVIVKQPLANGIPALAIPARGRRPDHPDWAWKWDLARRMDWGSDDPGARLKLALRWLLENPSVDTAIVGTSRVDHLEKNVAWAEAPPLDSASARHLDEEYAAARRAEAGVGNGVGEGPGVPGS